MAAIILLLTLQRRDEEIINLAVFGARDLDNETFFAALQIYIEMNDEEVASAYVYWLALVSYLGTIIDQYTDYLKLGLEPPEGLSEEEMERCNENIQAMLEAVLPASNRIDNRT